MQVSKGQLQDEAVAVDGLCQSSFSFFFLTKSISLMWGWWVPGDTNNLMLTFTLPFPPQPGRVLVWARDAIKLGINLDSGLDV